MHLSTSNMSPIVFYIKYNVDLYPVTNSVILIATW